MILWWIVSESRAARRAFKSEQMIGQVLRRNEQATAKFACTMQARRRGTSGACEQKCLGLAHGTRTSYKLDATVTRRRGTLNRPHPPYR
jgi:hypothetical protein